MFKINIYKLRYNLGSFIHKKSLRKYFSTLKENDGPLKGLKVLDLTRILAGPYCTMLLGDMGASIIKIERPVYGDDTRTWGPPFKKPLKGVSSEAEESAYFLSVNRNKKSMTLDIKSKLGKEILLKLIEDTDVLVENFLPGKMDEMGLGYHELKKRNKKLIYAGISGYGATGPYKDKPGYDVMVEAEAGLMYITGEKNGNPVKVGVAITDIVTGLYAHGAILAALLKRGISGEGQRLDISLIECQVASLANIASSYLIGNVNSQRQGTEHGSIVPYQSFPTKDGSIVIGAGNNKQFKVLCKEVLELESLLGDTRFSTNAKRVENREDLVHILSNSFREKTTEKWLSIINDKGIPFAPINDIKKTFEHPQVLFREMVQTINHPTLGDIKLVGPAVKYSDKSVYIRSPPPTLGQHTCELLLNLGYSIEDIENFKSQSVI